VEIIPVIDLLDGHVVHAQRGERSQYRPIRTPLCDSSEPLAIVNALTGLYPFRRLYIADLNAIQQRGDNTDAIRGIRKRNPHLDIWLDGGFRQSRELQPWRKIGLTCVLGSENLESGTRFLEMNRGNRTVLSLDFGRHGYMGPRELLDMPQQWPDKVIVMSLAQVGSSLGPDMQQLASQLQASRTRKPVPQIYAAGGIRNIADMQALAVVGAAGALVATALHNGNIVADDIAALEAA
jgi:phosphoribosylformimino-5-aminoimidazole carboxamide ribotide isomerase